MIWQVFYHDGSTFSDEDGGPDEAPATGVIAIVQRNRATKYQVLAREDFYVWREGGKYVEPNFPTAGKWYVATPDAYWRYMATPGWKRSLFGEYVHDELYNEIMIQAREAGKSATHVLERG